MKRVYPYAEIPKAFKDALRRGMDDGKPVALQGGRRRRRGGILPNLNQLPRLAVWTKEDQEAFRRKNGGRRRCKKRRT